MYFRYRVIAKLICIESKIICRYKYMKKENFFDAMNAYPWLVGSYGFFANSRPMLEIKILTNAKRDFGYLKAINHEEPFARFVLNEKAYELFYKVDNYVPKVMEIE